MSNVTMPPVTPRVLLVEDDPTSRAFLDRAVQAAAIEVDSADSIAAALALANAQDYDLWLLDAHLPDGDGRDLLARLRREHPDTPAIAHTASDTLELVHDLRASGFCDVLIKPLPAPAVQTAVRRALGMQAPAPATADDPGDERPLWDDEAAATALNGNRAHIDTLRGLFLEDLPQARERVMTSARAGDIEILRSHLHKLRASCGFVGAARLGEVVQALQLQPQSDAWLASFDQIARATCAQAAAPAATGTCDPGRRDAVQDESSS